MQNKSTPLKITPELFAGARPPAPSVSLEELAGRLKRIREEMGSDQLDALVLTDYENVRYFTDFHTNSWHFNSRPSFLVVTAVDLILFNAKYEKPHVEGKSRGFSSVYYDGYIEDGGAAVVEAIKGKFKGRASRIGIDYGTEMNGRGSLALIDALREVSGGVALKSATPALWRVRAIKTPFEVELKRTAFAICNEAFDQMIAQAYIGISEIELWRAMQAQTFLNGADRGDPFPVIFSKGDFMYGRPPSSRRLEQGHYVWSDFRATYGGYGADRNRIARAGEPEAWELQAYTEVRELTVELCRSVRPGMTCSEFYEHAEKKWEPYMAGNNFAAHAPGTKLTRFGHSGGMGIVELPNLAPNDHTVIRPGMILHIEPKLERNGAVFQFEEVIHVLEDGMEFVTPLCPETLPIIN